METHWPELPLEITQADVEMVYKALLNYCSQLECLKGWIDNEEAKRNIDEEIAEYKKLCLDIYESHMVHALCRKPVIRQNRAGDTNDR